MGKQERENYLAPFWYTILLAMLSSNVSSIKKLWNYEIHEKETVWSKIQRSYQGIMRSALNKISIISGPFLHTCTQYYMHHLGDTLNEETIF